VKLGIKIIAIQTGNLIMELKNGMNHLTRNHCKIELSKKVE
jgi:hypothetical protein